MGKYRILFESMEDNQEFNEAFGKGIECEGFCVIADTGEGYAEAIHHMSVDIIANGILNSKNLTSAAVLAKARREIAEINKGSFLDAMKRAMIERA